MVSAVSINAVLILVPFLQFRAFFPIKFPKFIFSFFFSNFEAKNLYLLHIRFGITPLQQVFEKKRHGVRRQNGIPGFSMHFLKESSYGSLRFERNGKIPLRR